ncbi:MAG: pyridoxal phosphate-dependent aminotransferase [Bacteroidales bacterium]|nr:pyridoxal phosphate-dependent aminotransferase [Bacteroidales bacterium]
MMYDFDTIIPRRGTNSIKWDARPPFDADTEGVIPLWVADMDFKAAPFIIDVLRKRVEHGVFGYVCVPDSYYEAVCRWFSGRHGWKVEKDWIIYTTGVVPALSAAVKALSKPGEKVILQSPVYNCFFSSVRNNGCEILDVPLLYHDGTYSYDFDGLERACADPAAKVMLLCNPHNPAGRVWTREELARVGDIARRHGVTVISDEIHCEIVMPGFTYTPFASVSPENQACCVTLCSPSKSFNTASLQIANIITSNPEWRKLIDRAINVNEICDVNPFGVLALEAEYSPEGAEWLKELNQYIYDNYLLLRKKLSDWTVCKLEGTYLPWVDVSSLGLPTEKIEEELLRNYKVWVNAGAMYGTEGFIRINLATPRSVLAEGLDRVSRGLAALAASSGK